MAELPPGFVLDQASPKEVPPPPPGFEVDGQPSWLGRKAGIVGEAALRGLTHIPGLPMDLVSLINRGIDAAVDPIREARGLKPMSEINPQVDLPATSEAFQGVARDAGLLDNPEFRPQTTADRYLSKIVEGATAAAGTGGLMGGVKAILPTAISGAGSGAGAQAGADLTSGPDTPGWLKGVAPVVGGLAGGIAAPAMVNQVGRTINAMTTRNQPALETYREAGIDPQLAGSVTGNRTLRNAEAKLMDAPGAGRIAAKTQETVRQVGDKLDDIAARYGQATNKTQAGEALQSGARRAADRFSARQTELYDDAFAKVGANTPTTLPGVTALRQRLEAELAGAPNSRATAIGPVLERIKALEADAAQAGGAIDFATFRKIRTDLGRILKQPITNESQGAAQDNLRALYGALTDDMKATAQSVSPEAAKALATADRYTRFYKTQSEPVLNATVAKDTAEQAYNFALVGGKDGASRLLSLRRNLKADEWGEVAAATLRRMGQANPGVQGASGDTFSVGTFLTNWNKMDPAAKSALFSGTARGSVPKELDNLAKIAGDIKGTAALANTSRTGGTNALIAALSAGAGAGAAALTGRLDVATGAIAGAAAPFVAGAASARLLTSPAFVRWLATPVPLEAVPAHIQRLQRLVALQPELAAPVRAYLENVPNQLQRPTETSPQTLSQRP